MERLNGANFMD
jgi:hypothetical protein